MVWDGADFIALGGDGRFSNHFYNPQDGGDGYLGFHDALTWAKEGGGNEYSNQKALEYFRDAFRPPNLERRNHLRAKMFVAVGHLLHLFNDMNVPAHTRADSHPLYEPLEEWMRGGTNADENGG
ncbi:MAG: hypothetical protein U9Q40_08980, partial [Campylobacterota bacterium]|nr:hypothetical protein [Campylobacterota bacterium]